MSMSFSHAPFSWQTQNLPDDVMRLLQSKMDAADQLMNAIQCNVHDNAGGQAGASVCKDVHPTHNLDVAELVDHEVFRLQVTVHKPGRMQI
jgi:hypothetical protein